MGKSALFPRRRRRRRETHLVDDVDVAVDLYVAVIFAQTREKRQFPPFLDRKAKQLTAKIC